ncbi:hypothetical protein H7F50_04975 [Novosphingobium flavum]|uniref:Uncharacterized protein n=1 Tax=Novosphingobium aerophilum TaxID=2839843 RepID=A0A7X1F860_9SPHN|nr:hypothetical protein [Novosphingobium aerophilum]MBC2652141.1 hypothetical protein [Novosphingobium aerophilum]MBC2661098.1 hypothetical protein [Novosphingobium aerophilum]
MQDARTRARGRKRSVARRLETEPDATVAVSAPAPGGPKWARGPAAFPTEIRVPPHRGAVIVAAPLEARPDQPAPATEGGAGTKATPRRRTGQTAASAPTKKTAPKRTKPTQRSAGKQTNSAKTDRSTRKVAKGTPRTASRQTRAAATTPALPLPAAPEALVQAPPAPSVPATEGARPAPIVTPAGAAPAGLAPAGLPRSRALVRPQSSLVARVVAWLDRLIPRRKRAALPKARTRLERKAVAPPAATEPAAMTPDPAAPPESASDLARRMLLQLSEENERLRREIDRLRAAASQPQS